MPASHLRRRQLRVAWGFLTPALLGVVVFFIYPLVITVYYSFPTFSMFSPPKWNNFANWIFLFTKDPLIGKATLNTLWFVVIMVPVRIIGALFVGWMLTTAKRAQGILRTIYYRPGPANSTLTFGQELYQRAFGSALFGYASAMAVVMFVVTLIVMFFLVRRFSDFNPEVAS